MSYNWPTPNLTVSQKVGIGIDTPTEALEVKGKVKLEQGTAINEFSTDSNLTDNSNLAIPTEQAVKIYVDSQINEAKRLIQSLQSEIQDLKNKIDALEQKSQNQVTNLQTQLNPLVNSPVLNAFINQAKFRVRSDNYAFFSFPNIEAWDIYANGQFYSGNGFVPNTPNRP